MHKKMIGGAWMTLVVLTLIALPALAGPGGNGTGGTGGNDPTVPSCTLGMWNQRTCDVIFITRARLGPFWSAVDYPNPFHGIRPNLGAPAPIQHGWNGSTGTHSTRFDIRDFFDELDRHCPTTRCQMTFTYAGSGGTYLDLHVSREADGSVRMEREGYTGDDTGTVWDAIPAYTVAWWNSTPLARETVQHSMYSADALLVLPATDGQPFRTRYPSWTRLP